VQPLDLLYWAVRALSFFNTIAFVWLGLSVLLNAERRPLGTWATGGGLLLAGLFFAVHSSLVGRDYGVFQAEVGFWWRYLWLLFLGPAHAWYLVIGWYSGALGGFSDRARLLAISLVGVALLILPSIVPVLPPYEAIVLGAPAPVSTLGGVPIILSYPVYSALCYAAALSMLRRPGRSKRFMGDLGRRRARPWLVAASLVMVGVSLSTGAIGAWLLNQLLSGRLDLFSPETAGLVIAADLAISALLALAVVLLGRAIVSYEIFTGKVLPRKGLLRHWRNGLILAGGFGAVVGGSLGLGIDPVYRLILAALLIAVFYALLSWRSYAERERSMERLRPFVASQRLYEHMLKPAAPLEVDVEVPFRVLCEEVLGARAAYLVAMGPLAPLIATPLVYPTGAKPPAVDLAVLAGQLPTPGTMMVPLETFGSGEVAWAVPLWSERGLIGALLLGEKRDGGLYVQEEIEVARAAAERLIDTRASAEMARRLMAVQRQRLAQTQLLDHQTRRVLHDDVLPRLHTAILAISGAGMSERGSDVAEGLAEIHRRIADLLRDMPSPSAPDVGRYGLVGALRRMMETEFRGAFDSVTWQVDEEGERAAGRLSPLVAEVVYGAARESIRNAARHGRSPSLDHPLRLVLAVGWQDGLSVVVEDDGVGLGSGDGATAGSGQGMALHSTMMAVVGGALSVEAVPGTRTRVSLMLPIEPVLPTPL
jgi:signal transduction histidine kinase